VNSTTLFQSPTSPTTRYARLSCDRTTAQRLADVLAEHFETASIAAFEDTTGGWSIELYADGALDEADVRSVIQHAAGEALARELVFGEVTQRDWVASSLAGLKPVDAGRFLVHGSHDRDRAVRAHIPIEIEAALAFGTGHHGTTRGCLLAFDQLVRARRPRRILDVGTGTGVLAIAAARMFHRPVVGTDIDKVAVHVAVDNARLNKVAPLFRGVHAPGVGSREIRGAAPYDLIFANILLSPLKLMAKPMARLVAPHGRVILSGLLPDHANAAIAAYRAQGLILEQRFLLDGWATLTLRRGA
jgi:ribosomal protein L11 methyltransferase